MMKHSLLVSLLFIVHFANAQTEEQKLTAVMKEFHQALINKNTVSINQQTDKALSYGHSNGWVETKAAMIKDLETGYLVYKSYTEDSVSVSINGSMANVRFIADLTAQLNGKENNFHLKVLEVWAKKSNRWILFARQAVKA